MRYLRERGLDELIRSLTQRVLGQGFRYSEGMAMALGVTLLGAGLGFLARRAIRAATLRRMRRDLDAILTAARLA